MECAGFIGGFIGGLCCFAPVEVVRDAVRESRESFSEVKREGEFTLPLDRQGEMDCEHVNFLVREFCSVLFQAAVESRELTEALDIFLDPTSPIAQRVWQLARLGRDVKMGNICQLCGQRDHKSDKCPNVKPPSSLFLPD